MKTMPSLYLQHRVDEEKEDFYLDKKFHIDKDNRSVIFFLRTQDGNACQATA